MPTLLDAFTRSQLYLEGFKLSQSKQYAKLDSDIRDVIRAVMSTVKLDTLGGLTRAALRALAARVAKAIAKLSRKFESSFLRTLAELTKIEARLTFAIMDGATPPPPPEDKRKGIVPLWPRRVVKDAPALWDKIKGEPSAMNGLNVVQSVENITPSIVGAITNRIAIGVANNETPAAVAKALVGSDETYGRDGILNRIQRQTNTLMNSVIQFVSQITNSAVIALYTQRYQWVSVLDDKTSDICRARDGKVFSYPDGPTPPAHPNCRSRVIPVYDRAPNIPDTFREWLKTQPADLVSDLGGVVGNGRFMPNKPLTLSQLADKLSSVLMD